VNSTRFPNPQTEVQANPQVFACACKAILRTLTDRHEREQLHAGDVCAASVLEELSAYAPVHAIIGNNDGPDVGAWGAIETTELNLGGMQVGMIHDAGPKEGRLARPRRRFPEANLVIFGHSHIPLQAAEENFGIFNPGSPTDKRRQPHRTLGLLEIEYGRLTRAEIVTLP
jgi:putative phosphoesterase